MAPLEAAHTVKQFIGGVWREAAVAVSSRI